MSEAERARFWSEFNDVARRRGIDPDRSSNTEIAAAMREAMTHGWAPVDDARIESAKIVGLGVQSNWYEIVSLEQSIHQGRDAGQERTARQLRLDRALGLPETARWSQLLHEAVRLDTAKKLGLRPDVSWEGIKSVLDLMEGR